MKSAARNIVAPAKINLCLSVIGKREDGYHELQSVMQKLELADVINVEISDGSDISLSCTDPKLPVNEDNLVYQAAKVFLDYTRLQRRVVLHLEKHIPVAAGLGGGSSDAAAVLLALDDLLQEGVGEAQLLEMAVGLGADVPFFIKPYPAAYAAGIGEKLISVPGIGDFAVLLVNPGFPVSTKWVFDNFALTTKGNPYILAPEKDCQSAIYSGPYGEDFLQAGSDVFVNDLEAVTSLHYPEISVIKRRMLDDGAEIALMSGSGPTLFAIFKNRDQAQESFDKFRNDYGPGVFLTAPKQS